jgi:TM2 domain-containing membrane protein YozV
VTYYSPYPPEPGDPRLWAPYGVDPVTGQPLSDKTKVTAGLLQMLLPMIGVPGVGRLYAGHIGIGLTQLLGAIVSYLLICVIIGAFTLWAFLLWSFIDGIVILAGSVRDGRGRLLR